MGITIIDAEDAMNLSRKFQTATGDFNPHSVLYLQAFAKAQGAEAALFDDEIEAFVQPEDKRWSLQGIFTSEQTKQKNVWNRVYRTIRKFAEPLRMGGCEYEQGLMEASVARHTRRHSFEAGQVDIDVNLVYQLSDDDKSMIAYCNKRREEEGGEYVDPDTTVHQLLQDEQNVTLPTSAQATVYCIAPKGLLNATKQMAQALAGQEQTEQVRTHRGCGLQDTMLKRALAEAKGDYTDSKEQVAWYDVHRGVFFTIDEDVFNRAKIAFGVTPELEPGSQLKAGVQALQQKQEM